MPDTDLTTLEAAQAWAGVSATQGMLDAASTQIQTWLGYAVASQNYTRNLNGPGGHTLFLPDRPVTAVTALQVGMETIQASPGPCQPGFVFDDKSIALIDYRFWRGIQNVVVSYTAGYAAVPPDIEQACLIVVKATVDRAARESDVVMQQANDTAQRFASPSSVTISSLLPPEALALLAPYRRVAQC